MESDDNRIRHFLVIIRGTNGAIPPDTIAEIKARLDRLARGRADMAFTSSDASMVGIICTAERAAAQLRAVVDEVTNPQDRGFVMVLSLDQDASATGNSARFRHIQRHLRMS